MKTIRNIAASHRAKLLTLARSRRDHFQLLLGRWIVERFLYRRRWNSNSALGLFFYFQYFDKFMDSQDVKTLLLKGKRYRRIKYGDEELKHSYGGGPPDPEVQARCAEFSDRPCHDC